MNLLATWDHLSSPRALVLDDLMLDCYIWGTADRTSQEAPVPVLRVQQREHRLGGAANVLGQGVTGASNGIESIMDITTFVKRMDRMSVRYALCHQGNG